MKILITGGAGFIGSHIVDAYINDGHEVVIIDNMSTGKKENINPKAKFYEIDICNPKVVEVFEKERPEILNHHAAQIDVRKSVENPLFDLKVNVGGLINLIEAGRKNGLKKIILASSGGTVYGEQEVFPATEDHPLRPISPYGLNKLASEQYLFYVEKEYGIKWVALRYANIYGPRQNPHGEAGVIAIFIKKMLAGEQPIINGDGKQTRDYVYVDDVVEVNELVLNEKANGAYNVGTGIETDVNKIFQMLKKNIGSMFEEKHVSSQAGEQRRNSIMSCVLYKEFKWIPHIEFKNGIEKTLLWFQLNK